MTSGRAKRKWFYCSKCKAYPDEIEGRYSEPAVVHRKWNGEFYELEQRPLFEEDYIECCGKCGTELEYKSASKELKK